MTGGTEADYRSLYRSKGYSDAQINALFNYVHQLETLTKSTVWGVYKQYNNHWCAFKISRNNAVFGAAMEGKETLFLYIKFPQSEADQFSIRYRLPYNERDHQAEYVLAPATDLERFRPLLQRAYELKST